MSKYRFTNNPGINYGMLSTANLDRETGIRYSVIPLHALHEYLLEDFIPQYGNPQCPQCATEDIIDLDTTCPTCDHYHILTYTGDCRNDSERYGLDHIDQYDQYSKYRSSEDFACPQCQLIFGNDSAYPEDPIAWTYERQGFLLELDSQNDVWIFKAPYVTYAQYCSPCAPGACYLLVPCREGQGGLCYALDDSFFSKENSCPYPLYSLDGTPLEDIADETDDIEDCSDETDDIDETEDCSEG